MIQVVLLCAGYGTRLIRDLEEDKTGTYKHLIGIPKPLLPVAQKPLIFQWLETFDAIHSISNVKIVTNKPHTTCYEAFLKQWNGTNKQVSLVNDGSHNNETRSGAVTCMEIGARGSTGDILFLAGDTLFDRTFQLEEMIAMFMKLQKENKNVCLLVSAPVKLENVSKHGIIEVNDTGRVTSFLEKPQLHETSSRLQSPCCYLISRPCLAFIQEFLEVTNDEPLSARDATGNFIRYLLSKAPVFAFPACHRFDIGNLESYIECCRCFP